MLASLVLPVHYLPLVSFYIFAILYSSNQMIIDLMTSLKVTLLPSALFLLVPCILPESPLWLIRFDLMKKMSQHRNNNYHKMSHILSRKGQVEEGRKVIQWLRGSHYAVEPEVKEMEAIAR